MTPLSENELIASAITFAVVTVIATIKALGTEAAQLAIKKAKAGVHHFLRVESVCPGSMAMTAVEKMEASFTKILTVMGNMDEKLEKLFIESRHQRVAHEITSDAAGIMIMRADEDGRITWVSKSVKEKFGAVDEGAFLGWSWLNRVHKDDRDRTRARWEQAIKDRCELRDEYRVYTHSGLVANVINTSKPVWCDENVVGWYCVLQIVAIAKDSTNV